MLSRLFVVALVLALAVPVASAAPPASPTILPIVDRYMWAEFDMVQPNLTTLVLSAELYVYRYQVNGNKYDADDLGNAYVGKNKYQGEASGDAFVLEIEKAVRDGMQTTLGNSFPSSKVSAVVANVDRTSLVAASGNPYDPPVHVTVSAQVERTRASLGLGELTDAGINAAFSSGAAVSSEFKLSADAGYHIIYTIHPPTGLTFGPAPGVATDGSAVVIDVDNTAGTHTPAASTVTVRDPSVTAPESEDIRTSFEVSMGAISRGGSGIPLQVDVRSDVHSLDVAKRFPAALPEKVSLPFINAEGTRALRATGVITDSDISAANEALLATVREDVSRAFGTGATVTGGLDTENMALPAVKPYTDDPPLPFLATAKTTYVVEGATGDDIDLALRIGGEASVDLALFAANGRETTYTIRPLAIAEYTPSTSGTIAADKASTTIKVPAGATEFPATLALRGRNIPIFTAEDSTVAVKVDLKDLDLTIGQALGGDFGNLLMEITVTGQLRVVKVSDELRGSLPDSLSLEYLSSDAIRLLFERGKLSEGNLTDLEARLLKTMSDSLGRALGGTVPVTGGLSRATLDASIVQTPISSDTPITFQGVARVTKPLAGGPVQAQAAMSLYSTDLPLTLPSLEGLDTVYTVILPKGLAVTNVQTSGGKSETSKSADGRDQFTVTPEGGDAKVTVSMAVTPSFVLAKFWPIVLLAVILIVLIVGTPVALVMRSRGKKRAAAKANKK